MDLLSRKIVSQYILAKGNIKNIPHLILCFILIKIFIFYLLFSINSEIITLLFSYFVKPDTVLMVSDTKVFQTLKESKIFITLYRTYNFP